MKVFGLGFPELAITSAVFAIPLVIGVLLIVALALDIRALLKYLRSTDRQQSHLELTKKAGAILLHQPSVHTKRIYASCASTTSAMVRAGRRPHPAFQPPP